MRQAHIGIAWAYHFLCPSYAPRGIDSRRLYLNHKHLKEAGPEPEGSLLTYEEIALVLGAASSDTHGDRSLSPWLFIVVPREERMLSGTASVGTTPRQCLQVAF